MSPTNIRKVATKDSFPARKIYATWEPGPEERNEMIRVAAYFIAERDGFKGSEAEHWAAAEDHVNLMLALRGSQEKLQIIIDTALDAVVLVDAQGVIASWSNHAESIFGWSRAEAVGRTLHETIIPLRYHEAHLRGMARFLATGEGQILNSRIEVSARHRDGHEFPVELSIVPIKMAGKYEFSAFIRDITERKLAEQELKRSNAELEQFSYAISHDMRQPLRMISSYLQLLEKRLAGQLDGDNREFFDFAIDGAKRLDKMLVALLEYSRVGRKGEQPEWTESRSLLEEALRFLQPAIAEAQAEVKIIGDWPRVFVSRDEMMRLIQNLIGNAVKYRVAGRKPEITVSSETVGKEWHLSVADNGVGILPDQIHRLFQVFQRLQTQAAYEGTGIGLALCRKIAEHHGGHIEAESAGEGLGSRFHVRLPIKRDESVNVADSGKGEAG